MEYYKATQLAHDLMLEHGLAQQGWTLQYNNRFRNVLGRCKYRQKLIELGTQYVKANGIEAVKDTILHEIAHAIAGNKAGHGVEWQNVCRRIGAKPNQFASVEEKIVRHAYRLAVQWPTHVEPLEHYGHRRTNMEGKLIKGRPDTKNRLVWIENKG